MSRYVIADPATGEIESVIKCDAYQVATLQPDGLLAIESQSATRKTHYVSFGALVDYTPEQVAAKAAKPAHEAEWSNASMAWVDSRSLDRAKADQIEALKASRDAAMDKNLTVNPHGKFVHDEAGRAAIEKAQARAERLTAKGQNADVVLTTADDIDVTLNAAAMYDVWNKSDNRIQNTEAQYRSLRAQVKAATTIEAVMEVVWP